LNSKKEDSFKTKVKNGKGGRQINQKKKEKPDKRNVLSEGKKKE